MITQSRGIGRTTKTLAHILLAMIEQRSVIYNASSLDYEKEKSYSVRKALEALGIGTLDFCSNGVYIGFYIKHPQTSRPVYFILGHMLKSPQAKYHYRRRHNAQIFTDHYRGVNPR